MGRAEKDTRSTIPETGRKGPRLCSGRELRGTGPVIRKAELVVGKNGHLAEEISTHNVAGMTCAFYFFGFFSDGFQ